MSGVTLYFYFQQSLMQSAEIRIINSANNVLIKIAQNPNEFKLNPENFLFLTTDNEFTASGILVQFVNNKGHIMAKSPSLKENNLPFSIRQDQILSKIEFTDGIKIIIYQTKIIINQHDFGYLVVGLPITQMYHYLSNLRNILFVVLISTLIILGFGINTLVSLNLINNQKMFLTFASHELRTPLAVIAGNSEIALKYDQSSQQYRAALTSIQEEAEWMNRLVSNLLFMFRTNAGSERLKVSSFHFGDLLIGAISSLKKRYPNKKITLNLSSESEIQADPDRIRQVINNLLDNAAQNTAEDGQITVALTADEKYFILTIKDNGHGIDKKQYKNIFKAFYRIHHNKTKGIGLGLAISKWIINRHQGKISVSSIIGKETTFTIFLPKIFNPIHSHPIHTVLNFIFNIGRVRDLNIKSKKESTL